MNKRENPVSWFRREIKRRKHPVVCFFLLLTLWIIDKFIDFSSLYESTHSTRKFSLELSSNFPLRSSKTKEIGCHVFHYRSIFPRRFSSQNIRVVLIDNHLYLVDSLHCSSISSYFILLNKLYNLFIK